MMTNVSMKRRASPFALRWAVLCVGVLTIGAAAGSASAGDCPGNPAALGTSRTLVVDPSEHPRIGTMQYGETLPLEDHEVVLTFDDGPLPRYSNQILDILASQCVKATFFTIGRMAHDYPEGVRRLRDAGHTIGTHTESHPLYMKRLPIERARQEIDEGIADVTAAAGDPGAVAPFFRIPGLSRAETAEDYIASLGVQTWSADFLADDWREISSARVADLAIKRLEAKGKGILLLHDIHERTVQALPRILQEMKARGYRIVQVVPATPERPKTPTEAQQWQLHPTSETVAISHWPKIPSFSFANTDMLPVQVVSESELRDRLVALPETFDRSRRLARGAIPLPQQSPWPRQPPIQAADNTLALPVPAQGLFEIPENNSVAVKALTPNAVTPLSHRVQLAPASSGTNRAVPGSVRVAAGSGAPNHTPARRHQSVTILATHNSTIRVRNSRSI
jgi:peptidoglycan/xylan/chitin deacetylase (PgdA/CDA1 family)